MMTSSIVLTFHKVLSGDLSYLDQSDPAVERYSITASVFSDILSHLSSERCVPLRSLSEKSCGLYHTITFDDGWISDYEVVLPYLLEKKMAATFFITVNEIENLGFVRANHIREMAQNGMEIASHGLSHCYLLAMSRAEARREIRESKERLEQYLGNEVVSFASVGGHYRKWMLDEAEEAGYRYFATMIPGKTYLKNGLHIVKRNHIKEFHDIEYVKRIICGKTSTFFINRMEYEALNVPKRVLGLRRYDKLKNIILKFLQKGAYHEQFDISQHSNSCKK